VDINHLQGLAYHNVADGHLCIGALERHAVLRDSSIVKKVCPLVAGAYEYVAHPAIRNRGTLCGNLCHADPASEMPSVVTALNATMVIRNLKTSKSVPAAKFFLGLYETDVKSDEMLVEVRIPIADVGQGWGFHEVSVRQGDFAIVAVAATLSLRNDLVSHVAIAVAGIGSTALRLTKVEEQLVGKIATDATLTETGLCAMQSVEPQSDPNATSRYRKDLVGVLVTRALKDARSRATAVTAGSNG
jgi:carbon-monoxide dehydrogenase medium subunit